MPLPQVAIVGRPNVGKSSLLNALSGRRVSIVDPTPGVTRDRVSSIIELSAPAETPRGTPGRWVELIDTGGYGVYTAEGKRFDDVGVDLSALTPGIEQQIRFAVEKASLVLFIIDAQTGLTPLDETVAGLLRKGGHADKVQLVANKVDDESWESHAAEAASLGLGEPLGVSATTRYGLRRLSERVYERLGGVKAARKDAEPDKSELTFAIVGKRNAGKSTLINALAGEERVIVSEIAGTTRDSIDVRFEIEGHTLVAIDTAGLRKRKSIHEDVEYYSLRRALAAIRRADVCVLLIDATEPVSQVDKKLSQELQEQFKPTVIVVNKWDLAAKKGLKPEDYAEYLTAELRGLDYAPVAFISARSGEGVRDLVAMTINLHQQACHRESTSNLNEAIRGIMAERGPSSRLGTQARVYYISQVATNPPTIVLMVNDPKLFEGQYERYLLNRLREELPFSEVPIRLFFRPRKRMELGAMKHRGRRREQTTEFGEEVGDES
ncbi:MAG: ribosome biogenesis GTPase Der [Phycisphaeraceae bacterium]|nr:ribosome biogenesis GTPase Der [Phycisphaerales bacterium]QOJ17273.1 MAG: ribosome biogenesis GTPase Der [Phycisphaeraceae bacterium]